jgi:alkanesulfonate monooxygenase SsuD/methylene tetrahydromethanopterin reductase-like flavin-dependent oxidoreductase (luciferase family)/predicted kinase
MELRLPAPCLVVLVGPSKSGKTTWAESGFRPTEIVSSDRLRAMVGSGEDDQSASTPAFDLLERIVAERMRRGLTTVIDTTGLDPTARARWIEVGHGSSIPVYAVVFDTPPDVMEQRNRESDRPIPIGVLKRQISRLRSTLPLLTDEGFDGVHTPSPPALVTPRIRTAHETTAQTPKAVVSRFDWEGDLAENLTSIALRAEAAGFRDLWVMDHFRQIPGVGREWEDIPEAYAALSFVAARTTTIRLGALVSGITHRHPVVLGKTIATLDVLSGGRAVCGLGIAWNRDEHEAFSIPFPTVTERYRVLEDTLEMLPLLWGKGSPPFRGRTFASSGLTCYPRPIQDHIPVMVGGSGERRTLRLVAKHADACNLFGDPETIAAKVEVLRAHCSEMGRDPTEIEVTHLLTVLSAPDRAALRDRIDMLRGRNRTPEEYATRANAGTPEDHISLFSAYDEAGATHSIVVLPDVAMEGSVESFSGVIRGMASG